MRKTTFFITAATHIALFASPLATAQQDSSVAVPPGLEKLDDVEAPAVTIRRQENKTSIVEKREKGQVTSIKVESGPSTYYLKPDTPHSSAFRNGAQGNVNRAAQWQVMEFDWKREPDRAKEIAAQAATAAPPPALSVPEKN